MIFGRDTASGQGFGATLDFASLDGTNGFTLNGIDESDRTGSSVAAAGDVNGDGIDDLIVGAFYATPNGSIRAGESYVLFGSDAETGPGFGATLELEDLDGTNGFTLTGIGAYDYTGFSVASAGDVNGDGVNDLIIGAVEASPNGLAGAGESYVVFGRDTTSGQGFATTLDLGLLDGSNGFTFTGSEPGDGSGFSVASAGDVNGDGIDDLIVGAAGANRVGNFSAGESYVVFGRDAEAGPGFGATLDLASLDGRTGFTLTGIDALNNFGYSVASAGDINGDGIDDLIIGANLVSPDGKFFAGASSDGMPPPIAVVVTDDAGAETGRFATIAAALEAVTTEDGATLTVLAETYAPDAREVIVVNKAVSIVADTNLGIDPTTAPDARGREVVVDSIDINADSVRIDGLTIEREGAEGLDPRRPAVTIDGDDVELFNNIVRNEFRVGGILLRGSATIENNLIDPGNDSAITHLGGSYLIQDNVIEIGEIFNNSIGISLRGDLGGTLVTGNEIRFTRPDAAGRGILLDDLAQPVANVTLSNNSAIGGGIGIGALIDFTQTDSSSIIITADLSSFVGQSSAAIVVTPLAIATGIVVDETALAASTPFARTDLFANPFGPQNLNDRFDGGVGYFSDLAAASEQSFEGATIALADGFCARRSPGHRHRRHHDCRAGAIFRHAQPRSGYRGAQD